MKNVIPRGFGHLFQAELPTKSLQLMADLEYPQAHSMLHAVGVDGMFKELDECSDEQICAQGGSRVQAAVAAMVA